jgi:hypothetical protein
MNNEPFYLFFGILGLIVGGIVVWFVLAEHPFEGPELRGGPVDEVEASFLAQRLAGEGHPIEEETIARLIELHQAYFDGRIWDSVAAAEAARVDAERTPQVQETADRDVS